MTNILAPHHQALLTSRAVSPEVAAERGYSTIIDRAELRREGFSPLQSTAAPGLLIPRWHPGGTPAPAQFRPDVPRVLGDGHRPKYETPAGSELGVDALVSSVDALRAGAECWLSVEGHLKADAMLSAGAPATMAVVGVWSWKTPRALVTWAALCASRPGRRVHVVADSDFVSCVDVARAVVALVGHLAHLGAKVRILHPPWTGEKVGADDHLARGGTLDDLDEVPMGVADRVFMNTVGRPRRAYHRSLTA